MSEDKRRIAIEIIGGGGHNFTGTRVSGFEVGIKVDNSTDLNFVDTLIEESKQLSSEDFINNIENDQVVQQNIESAAQGNSGAKEFLKKVAEGITVQATAIAFRVYLTSKGIEF